MADTERTFTTYDPRLGLGRFAPPESDQWVRLGPAAGADGAAYVVDVGRGRLLEYPLALPGGALPPRSVLDPQSSAGLAGAVEIAVSSEEVYVLLRDGRLLRYNLAGQRLPFPGLVPDRPLDAPTGLALGLRGGGVYVADAGNQRVVQFSRAGEFVRQFQATAQAAGLLAGLRAVRVDEAAHRLVGLTSRAVLLFDLPPEGP
ncbi:MAG: hypothetical protein HY690_05645 [Chloroflexi bacterium]|nr:hypothetical protein [Chloroflexota bacterium]